MEDQKNQEDKQQFSLKQNCKNRIKALFDHLRQVNKGVRSYLLVVDSKSLKLISSYMNTIELMEMDIIGIEQLENQRKPYQKQHAVYYLSPSPESVQLLLQDFTGKKDYQYGFIHVFFTNQISQGLMKQISENQFLMNRLITFKEFNQDFMCKFDNIINLDLPEALTTMFSQQGMNKTDLVNKIAHKLTTVVTSLEKFYGIEIIYNRESNKISELIANQINQRLVSLLDHLQQDESQRDVVDKNAGKVTFLILDRSVDPLSPLIRDFHYQPMLYDLCQIQNDLVEYDGEDEKGGTMKNKAILSDVQDQLFPRYKFKHIAEVMEGIPEEFQEFVKNNTNAQVQRGELKEMDFNTMSDVIKKMPKYKQLLSKYTMHIKLIQDCWKEFEQKDLAVLGEIEQTLATGINEFGKEISATKIMSQIGSRLASDKLSQDDKARMVLISCICLEIVEKDRQSLIEHIQRQSVSAILNLKYLGIDPTNSQKKKSKSKAKKDKQLKKKAVTKMQSQSLSLCRHTTYLETLIDGILTENDPNNCIENGLPMGKFDSLKINLENKMGNKSKGLNGTNTTSKKKKLQALIGGGGEEEEELVNSTPKLIVFVVGGISYSEIRALKNLSKTANIGFIVGGTTLLSPSDYLHGLEQIQQ